jgi:hypothetical protein
MSWLDGKPIYQKIVSFGKIAKGTNYIAGYITDFAEVITCRGFARAENDLWTRSISTRVVFRTLLESIMRTNGAINIEVGSSRGVISGSFWWNIQKSPPFITTRRI